MEEFWLVELSGQVAIFGGSGYSVACKHCDFEKPIEKADEPRYSHLAEQYRAVLKGEISLELFEREVDAMKLKAITEIRNESRSWTCAACDEENPMTFETCWKCGAAATVAIKPASSAPRPPDLGGGHPWERGRGD